LFPGVSICRPPLLIVDDVLEESLVEALVAHLDTVDLVPSPSHGVAADGQPGLVVVPELKSRLDHPLRDERLTRRLADGMCQRLLPEVERCLAHRPSSFEAPKLVRYVAGCGWFTAHRDNTTPDSAHRRLAVTINLGHGYEGGDLRFPEFGPDTYRPGPGAALVFSCGLLHEVTPVIAGTRDAVLSFLW
jgi:predicted 2-oxoglutarate/Fe(II)-dependent dioxygenase YbiX